MPLHYTQPRSYERILELLFSDQLSLIGCLEANHPGGHWLAGLCVSGLEYPARLEPSLLELSLLSGSGLGLSTRESGGDGKAEARQC